MNMLVEILVACAIVGLVLGPLYALSAGNVNRCGFTLERKEAHHLAWALVERFRDDGLPALLGRATRVDSAWQIDDPHETDGILRATLASERLEGRGGVLRTRVRYWRDWNGKAGLGRLECLVELTREGQTVSARAGRLILALP